MFYEATITISPFFFALIMQTISDKWVTCVDAVLGVITPIKAFPDTVSRLRLVSDLDFMETRGEC